MRTPNGVSGFSIPALSNWFSQHIFIDLAETKALGPSNVLNLWLGMSKDMHPIAKFCGIIRTVTKLR